MRIHLITSCSSTRLHIPVARVQDLPTGLTNAEAIDQWVSKLNSFPASTTPKEQYRGQGFLTLLKILNTFKLESTHIITGGLGFTDINEAIVPYDFSASPKEEHNILQKVTAEPFSLNVWWSLINQARHGDQHPVATFVNSLADDEVVLISCSKLFLKYIAQDFLSADPDKKNQCRILLTGSSVGSVPMQLRPYIVAFERIQVNHIPGNRNDINHRAMEVFLSKVTTMEEFQQPSYALARDVFGVIGVTGSNNSKQSSEVIEYLNNNPDVLHLPESDAYRSVYRVFGPFGGRNNFSNMFKNLRIEKGLDTVSRGQHDDDALEVLKSMMNTVAVKVEKSPAFTYIERFIDALESLDISTFDAATAVNWATKYCYKKEEPLPEEFSNAIKAYYFLSGNAATLGLLVKDKLFEIIPIGDDTDD